MLITLTLLFTQLMAPAGSEDAPERAALAQPTVKEIAKLDFLAGDWTASFETFDTTVRTSSAGRSTGTVRGEFGPGRTWLEIVARTTLRDVGPYAVRVVIYGQAGRPGLSAFMVNSLPGSATYAGRFLSDSAIVFETEMTGRRQRVRYEKRGDRIRFSVDESIDGGVTYHPHTESWWIRSEASEAKTSDRAAPHQESPPAIAHVEIPATDPQRAAEFYERAFAWPFDVLPDENGALTYWLGTTGDPNQRAVTVGVARRSGPDAQPIFTVYVADIESTVTRILEHGGRLDGPVISIPDAGRLAYLSDPEGNHFAVFQQGARRSGSGAN